MGSSEQPRPPDADEPKPLPSANWEDPNTFVSSVPQPQAPPEVHPQGAVSLGWPPVRVGPSRVAARLELSLAISGIALVAFMVMHMGLLLSAMLGAATMDRLASFLERYYLLQSVAPLLILLIFAHSLSGQSFSWPLDSQSW